MFGPDADVDPLKRPPNANSVSELRQNPPEISHGNTMMRDEDDLEPSRNSGRSSARASSPTRSRVAAAIGGTPCRSDFTIRTSQSISTDTQCIQIILVPACRPSMTTPSFPQHHLPRQNNSDLRPSPS
jgi:hypothetical protein